MLLFRSIQAGWKTAGKSDRLLLLFYLASLVYASIAATSLYWVGRTELNFSLTGASLAGRFDLSAVLEFMLRHYDFLVGSGAAIIGVVGLYMLLSVFLSGGTISLFVSGRTRYDAALFWGNCGYYFSPFVLLAILSVCLYALLFWGLFPGLSALLRIWLGEVTANSISAVVNLAVASFVFTIADFAKVNLVITGERHVFSTFGSALAVFFKHIVLSLSFLLSFLAMNAFLYLLFSFLSDFLQAPTVVALLALVTLQQVYIVLRLKLRLTFWATLVELHPHLFLKMPSDMYKSLKKGKATKGKEADK